MTAAKVQQYQRQLRELAARLSGEVSTLQTEALRPIEGLAAVEPTDGATRAAAQDVELTLIGIEGQTLAEVNGALDRIDRGTFGRCEKCGHTIAADRLETIPYARNCVTCARTAARNS
ncbi:MAG TPA: TraR/DksA C4-type zinc finger protein [Fimbriiglobus sp.]